MILNITTTHKPATDLGYLLHKHPDKFQTFNLSVGKAHIFYPEISKNRATISLLLDIDPIGMVRNARRQGGDNFLIGKYVNDRPYVASSFMSNAISKTFSTAMNGRCKDKPELVNKPLPFEVVITSLPAPKGGEQLIKRLFEPLGYDVQVERHTLDEKFPQWGESKYYNVTLKNRVTTQELLSHLYVLIPTLDQNKHYFVSHSEIDKLLQKGEGWLENHPEKEQITNRYLINLKSLSRRALEKLRDDDAEDEDDTLLEVKSETDLKKESLHEIRLNLVIEKLVESGAETVADLGCGEGKLIRKLLKHKQFSKILGMDVSYNELLKTKERIYYDEMSAKKKERIELLQGSVTYRDRRIESFDAIALVEVIEHIDLNRLESFERVIFEFAKPKTVVLTTPNKEYNVIWGEKLEKTLRHDDHRFEWTRGEFQKWANEVGEKYNYKVEILPIGTEEVEVGTPSQMAIFKYGN